MEVDTKRQQTSQETTSGRAQAATADSGEPPHFDIKEGSSTREEFMVAEETDALMLTGGERPLRNLKDFIFHNLKGFLWPVEMYDIVGLYITATILPLDEESMGGGGVRCECFGKIDSWKIHGYERGSTEIRVSTASADYICTKPALDYRKYFEATLRKAVTCIEVFKKLSRRHGGNPELSLDELLSLVVHSTSRYEIFSKSSPNKAYVISLGAFVYHHLTKSNEIMGDYDQNFTSLPVLVALRDEGKKNDALTMPPQKVIGTQSDFRDRFVFTKDVGAIFRKGVDPDKYYSPRKRTSWRTEHIMATSGGSSRAGIKDGSFANVNLKTREEIVAGRPTITLENFVFHSSRGLMQPLEMCKVIKLYITVILPKSGKCRHFGRILSWEICGFGQKNPSICVSTEEVDYTCIKPISGYKEYFDVTFRKALICFRVFKLLSEADLQNEELSLDALLSAVVVSLRENEYFAGSFPTKDYIISLGLFISKQMAFFDDYEENGQFFYNSPVIVALRDECKRRAALSMPRSKIADRSLKTEGETLNQSVSSRGTGDEG